MARVEIQLPSQLDDLIRSDTSFEAAISQARRDFGPILRANKLTFFPEYPDHGIEHIQNVISTAYGLVRDNARELLTAADGAVLVLSIILHDLALHLEKDGFILLVTGNMPHQPVPWFKARFEERPWDDLWDEYRDQVSRYSGRKNTELFGSPEPVPPPDLNISTEWSEKQFLLVGDFIRQHHGRLAHEIARHGFPGRSQDHLLRLDPQLGEVSDIAGLIARSHTLPLRPCVDYLKAVFRTHAIHAKSMPHS